MELDMGGRRRGRFSLPGLIIGFLVMNVAGGLGYYYATRGGAGGPQTPLARALPALEAGGPVLRLIQLAGEPSCRSRLGDEDFWVYAADDGGRPGCEPVKGDLVVFVDREQRISALVPQYELYKEVRSKADWTHFAKVYRPEESKPRKELPGLPF